MMKVVSVKGSYYKWSDIEMLIDSDIAKAIDDGGRRTPWDYLEIYQPLHKEKYGVEFSDVIQTELQPIEKIQVEYSGGESREIPGHAVDYMLCEFEGIELYAEKPIPDNDTPEQEEQRYNDLCDMIADKALNAGIDPMLLVYWYD